MSDRSSLNYLDTNNLKVTEAPALDNAAPPSGADTRPSLEQPRRQKGALPNKSNPTQSTKKRKGK
ncbi:hypothetical protein L209DRAFT_748733 [Thermothelomyces heterothallicus CBS 203.75]